MTNAGSKEKGEGSTLKYQKSKAAESQTVPPNYLPVSETNSTKAKGPQQASEPNIKVPEGSITEYTYMQYRLGTRPIPGNLNARTCRPSHASRYKCMNAESCNAAPKQ